MNQFEFRAALIMRRAGGRQLMHEKLISPQRLPFVGLFDLRKINESRQLLKRLPDSGYLHKNMQRRGKFRYSSLSSGFSFSSMLHGIV
jgi:hypothetical protein